MVEVEVEEQAELEILHTTQELLKAAPAVSVTDLQT
jgi:hypothetical protein